MKKHIQKRHLNEFKADAKLLAEIPKEYQTNSLHFHDLTEEDFKSNYIGYIRTDKDYIIKGFHLTRKKKNYLVPEPDIVLIYFNFAYISYVQVNLLLPKVDELLKDIHMNEEITNTMYNFFGHASAFTIMLFTAIEAFINRNIPDDYIYENKRERLTELYNKKQIERHLDFDTKMKIMAKLPGNRNFNIQHPSKYNQILKLKKLRDMIVHTKTDKSGHLTYGYLYEETLGFKYFETLTAVAEFLNFYSKEKDFVAECPCSNDW